MEEGKPAHPHQWQVTTAAGNAACGSIRSDWRLPSLPHCPRITLSPDGTLRLANVSKSDAGGYTCFARNRFGMSSTTGRLLVTGKLRNLVSRICHSIWIKTGGSSRIKYLSVNKCWVENINKLSFRASMSSLKFFTDLGLNFEYYILSWLSGEWSLEGKWGEGASTLLSSQLPFIELSCLTAFAAAAVMHLERCLRKHSITVSLKAVETSNLLQHNGRVVKAALVRRSYGHCRRVSSVIVSISFLSPVLTFFGAELQMAAQRVTQMLILSSRSYFPYFLSPWKSI